MKRALVLFALLMLPACAWTQTPRDAARILVVYHSDTGHTEKLAQAVADGALQVEGARVHIKRVADVEPADVASVDALIVGSPTHWSNVTVPIKQFIDTWPDLVDRIGAAFATGGATSGGREHVITSIVLGMLSHGMIVVGPVYREGDFRYGAAGVSAVTGSSDPGVSEAELLEARQLGQRVAEFAIRRANR